MQVQGVMMKVLFGCGIGALALMLVLLLRPQLDAFGCFVRRLSNLERAFCAGFLVLFVAYGGAKPPPPDPPLSAECAISVPMPGWHEMSFPVLPEGGSPDVVFAAVADQIGYVTYGSENWSPMAGGTLTALEIGKGYWVQTTAENVAWTVTGQTNPDVEISLKQGWNLIGYPLIEEGDIEAVLATALATGKIDWICSGSRVYPGALTTLAPGKGYWAYANAAVTIRFDFE